MKKLLNTLALLCLSLTVHAQTFTGKVTGVSDGDTIRVLRVDADGKREVKIRLNGVDTPETAQPYGSKAKQFTSAFAFGKIAEVKGITTDKYGRLVADVRINGRNLNQSLVEAGLAWWYRQYAPKDDVLEMLESEARLAKRGLWVDSNPTPPWDWRHSGGRTNETTRPTKAVRSTRSSAVTGRTRSGNAPVIKSVSPKSFTVFVTRTGDKYHSDGCRYLRRSQIAMSAKDAVERYTPCSVCAPRVK